MRKQPGSVSMGQLWRFFLPLGLSASLVTISHVIINSTLTHAANQKVVIASYALAMSLLIITERPAVLLRQTCSALVRDKRSFRAMLRVGQLVFASILLLGMIICYTPLGRWIFGGLFGADDALVPDIVNVYQILMFVSIFSGIRCLYHGVIIYNMRTKWLTIGMALRLIGMYGLSLYFMHQGVNSGTVGAIIFLTGMMIEALVSYLEGSSLVRSMPERVEGHEIGSGRQIFSFYRPMLLSTLIAVWIGPSINALLGKTSDAALSIASFALAASLVQLTLSFFTYFHQIVLNFYRTDPGAVRKFTLLLGFVPTVLVSLLAFTPAGEFIVGHIMGVEGKLKAETIRAMQPFVLLALALPWLDVGNGIIMVRGQTRVVVGSQSANLLFTLLTAAVCILFTPGWNGAIGAWAQSIGVAAECLFIAIAIRRIGQGTKFMPRQAAADLE
ncbi:multi antimicrobial extrusion protein MatE [Paenibacillus montanisoli]|uniref:Multi antimicrobial extrusion protein MatE n=1 Tax=Paenibacillus montanisoli TaxID=2081970 RepID=A0A328U653_9BACL|nr:multi antimicrobial extrusion protein MatE [Paenibacillus montanisoli]RAP75534.1 multi antimicrobial extrusion protein MatE [Paenibacillus montanisoli]